MIVYVLIHYYDNRSEFDDAQVEGIFASVELAKSHATVEVEWMDPIGSEHASEDGRWKIEGYEVQGFRDETA